MISAASLAEPARAKSQPSSGTRRHYPAQRDWTPVPPQVPASEGLLDVGGDKIWYWDTGGGGPAVILLHALTGSAANWGYQQPVLRHAGYRVIAYSRRGHFKSQVGPGAVAGTAAADLHALAAFLQLPSFHLLGTAGGAFVAIDYAISHPDSLLSLIIASSTGDIDDPAYKADCARLAAPDLLRLPSDLKELGPAYRAGYPAGHARWNELEAMARTRPGARQAKENDVSWENVSKIRAPTLLISGGADSYSPPPIMEMVSARIPNSSLVVIDEAGHSAYWEQPRAFNDAVLNFLGGISVNRKPAAALPRRVSQDTLGG